MQSRRLVPLAAALVLPLALAACGTPTRATPSTKAQPNPVRSASPTVFPAPTKSAAPSPTTAPTGTASATADPGNGGGGNTVQATADNKFTPAEITVKAGSKVTWAASGFHTATGGSDGKKDPTSPIQGPAGFQTYEVTFDKPGTYNYYCEPHLSLGMVGKVVVT